MTADEVQALIVAGLPAERVSVTGGGGKYEVLVVSGEFDGLNRVRRQQRVYRTLNDQIASGAIHAVSIRALTPAEAEQGN